jgi:hypothetical protein
MKNKKQFFRKTAESIVLGIMVVLFAACTKEPSKTEIIRLEDIPEEYLATVPYRDGDVVKMMHESNRLIINYHVSRGHFSTLDEPSGWYGSPVYDYQVYWTTLKPDYPTFEMEIFLSNEYMRYELEGLDASKTGYIVLANSDANVPFINTDATDYIMLDSLEVNGHVYYDVFKLDCDPDYTVTENDIYSATCYYNYAKGFIGIEMSNGEKYWLYEE